MSKTIKIVRTESDARQWLAENGVDFPVLVERNGANYVVESARCGRCGGSGRGPWFQDGGICYECRGANTMNRVRHIAFKKWVQRLKAALAKSERDAEVARARAEAAQERMLEGQRDWCEANGYGRITFEERDEQRRAERAAKAASSQHVGTVGERRNFTATIKAIPEWDNAYGTTYCHIMEDADGNTLVWRASNTRFRVGEAKAKAGDTVTFVATIKEHGAREGVKQTIVQRAKASEIIQAAKAA